MSEQKICKRAHRYGNVIAIATIRLIADFVASNGFQFGKLFFPADILHQLPAWRSVGERDLTTRNRMFSIRPFTSYPDFAEHVIEITFRSLKREIADINLLCHLSSLFLWTELRSGTTGCGSVYPIIEHTLKKPFLIFLGFCAGQTRLYCSSRTVDLLFVIAVDGGETRARERKRNRPRPYG